jgi:integrase
VASIQKRPDGRWRARYRDPSGRERAKHFTRKVDAERFLTTVEASKLRGAYVDPSDRTTVAEYARRWAAGRPHRATTARRMDAQIRNHIEGTALGGRRLASVLPSDVQAWVTDRSRILAPSSLRQQVTMLRAIFSAAAGDRLIGSSPFVRISVPRAEAERVVPLTVDQVRVLADAVPPRCQAMVLTQAGLGLRLGELLALRAVDVDFLRRTVRVEHQLEERTRARVEPKTPRSRRTIPLPAFVGEALAEHMREDPPLHDGTLFYGERSGRPFDHAHYATRIFGRAVARLAPAGDVLAAFGDDATARPAVLAARLDERWRDRYAGWRPGQVTAVLELLGVEAGAERDVARAHVAQALDERGAFPAGITTHDLRHHYASVLLAGGESVVAVAERLGHEDASEVLSTYGHLMPDSEDRTRKVVDAAWSTGGPGLLRVAAGGSRADSTRTEGVP